MTAAARDGAPGLRIGGDREFVDVRVLGRERPDATDQWDGNWLESVVTVAAGAFHGTWRATLRADDLAAFHGELAAVLSAGSGTARLRSMEEWLALDVELDHLGHARVTGRGVDQPGTGNRLDFALPELDRSGLAGLVRDLDGLLEAHPVRSDEGDAG